MKNTRYYLALAGLSLMLPLQVLAVDNPFKQSQNMVSKVGTEAGIQGSGGGLTELVGRMINIVLGFLGIIFLVLMLYAGFLWMTAGGDKAGVEKAKSIIQQAVIGLVVVVAAYAISNFVLGSLLNATGQG